MKKVVLLLLGIFAGYFTNIYSQNIWKQTNGPSGGNIGCIAINSKGHIFAADEGIWRSTDNGENWTRVSKPFVTPSYSPFFVSMKINSNDHIFIGTTQEGIFRSTDNGETWTKINSGLPTNPPSANSLAINGEGHIFAGTTWNGIYKSTNNGDNWIEANNDNENILRYVVPVYSLAINSSGYVFASTNFGIFRSIDNGDSWARLAGDLLYGIGPLTINSKDHIFTSGGQGISRSTDNGETWTPVTDGIPGLQLPTALAVDSKDHIYAGFNLGEARNYYYGVFRSTDNGDSWIEVNNDQVDSTAMINCLVVNSNDHVFIGTRGSGVFRTTDNGENWIQTNKGLTDISIVSLAVNSNYHLFAGTNEAGIFRSIDKGENWAQINPKFLDFCIRYSPINSIVINSNGNILIASYYDELYGGILQSTDEGDSWTQTSDGLAYGNRYVSLAINSSGQFFTGNYSSGIFHSTNTGDFWTYHNVPRGDSHTSLVINSNDHIFTGFLRFRPVGIGWGGVLQSTNNGENWNQKTTGLSSDQIMCLVINSSDQIFAGTNLNGIFHSTNNGDNWVAKGLTNLIISSLRINSDGYIFAGTSEGVFISTNNGDTWTTINNGLTDLSVLSLAIDSSVQVYCGTTSDGIFINSNPVSVEDKDKIKPSTFSLDQNYPNPFNPTTKISYSIPQISFVTLKIYDVLGNEIATLVNEEKPAGNYKVEFDGSNPANGTSLSSGVYFYRIQAGSFTGSKKLILLK